MGDGLRIRAGFYLDNTGKWQKERRRAGDRRAAKAVKLGAQERRGVFRRHADRELYEKRQEEMIEEALTDFAEEHGGRV